MARKKRCLAAIETGVARSTLKTAAGEITLIVNDSAVCALFWEADLADAELRHCLEAIPLFAAHPVQQQLRRELQEYFAGQRKIFAVKAAANGSEFQKLAWSALGNIPYGEKITYGEQAARMNRPKAVRAVGSANGANPLSIIVPCHRVVSVAGAGGGFAGGLSAKKILLELEEGA